MSEKDEKTGPTLFKKNHISSLQTIVVIIAAIRSHLLYRNNYIRMIELNKWVLTSCPFSVSVYKSILLCTKHNKTSTDLSLLIYMYF